MFGVGLVFMYLHKGYHILLYAVTRGKKSYNEFSDQERQMMQMHLLFQVQSMSGLSDRELKGSCLCLASTHFSNSFLSFTFN